MCWNQQMEKLGGQARSRDAKAGDDRVSEKR